MTPFQLFVSRIMYPCTLVMGRLGLRTKLLCMAATFTLPLLLLSIHLAFKYQQDLDIAAEEANGVVISRQIMDLITGIQKHRGLANLKFAGQDVDQALSSVRNKLVEQSRQIHQAVTASPQLGLATAWQALSAQVQQLADGKLAASAAESLAQHHQLVAESLRFLLLEAEKSGLVLDPEASTYFLMDVSIQKIPAWIENLAQLRGLGAGFAKKAELEFNDKAVLIAKIDSVKVALATVINTNPSLQRAKEAIPASQKIAVDSSEAFIASATKNLLGDKPGIDANLFFEEGTNAIGKLLSFQTEVLNRLDILLQERVREHLFKRNLTFSLMLIGFLFISYVIVGFYHAFLQGLNAVSQSSRAVASGDLTAHVQIDGKDELAQTGLILEHMNFNLSALVANVRTNASMVSQLGHQLATGISDLSIRTEQQASSLEQTSASVEDLADTVKKNAESARSVDTLAAKVRLIAESSGTTMHAAVDSMHGIQTSALKVQEIVSLIDTIAFQTNILALNAAVEAARAGEQGRGFAVVAAEVRNLAQRSAGSAKEIKLLIDDSVSRVKTGVSQINEVSTTLTDIVDGIRNLAGNINSISTASEEQSNGLAQISEAIRHLDEITQSNGQMAEQAKNSAVLLEERALGLSKAVSSFKLRQGTADEALVFVNKAVSLYQSAGRNALSIITADKDRQFADRDMYVFAFDRSGQYRAFAGNASKLQVNLLHVNGLDGRKLVADAFAIPFSGGWVDYTILNPSTQKIDAKMSYIVPVSDDLVLGCGVYKIV
ncbi:methyl-accepting chemotaxis protein [Undibacterium sp. Jales W-56]|uniref:methyl-accepting chemotaxis protein n=1 Tax=Undibacterium sp. Jales W-56 TaxID=2897325 RepID=UPI0021CE7E40|nr:methyl-accepting chemotaxis protein [Undibacterium sp. Jales W-56]MCU6434999.1 methyl-accepting chemotaxis protein [Undibacterium sp. Jales W-56]